MSTSACRRRRIHRRLSIEELEPRVAPATIFVDANVSGGSNDGTSWGDAYSDLQSALGSASSGDEIWVGDGTYTPTSGADRTISFDLVSGVALYGGFDGTETSRSQRDWTTNIAILSGDLDGDDAGFTNNGENSYHVVTADGVTVVLDGFTVSGGNANGWYTDGYGGGMYNTWSAAVTIANCTFTGNSSTATAGALVNYVISSSSTVTDCLFLGNRTDGTGGAVLNRSSDVALTNCVFSENTAAHGGAAINKLCSPTFTNCVFSENASSMLGGAIYDTTGSPTLTSCTFFGNSAMYGGAIYNANSSSPTLVNSILWGDTASVSGNEISNVSGSTAAISYCDIEGSGGSGVGWDTSLGTDGGGNIDSDPLFYDDTDPDGADNVFATSDDGLTLATGSPAVDAGTSTGAPSEDIAGIPRPLGTGHDLGAYERWQAGDFIIYPDPDGETYSYLDSGGNLCWISGTDAQDDVVITGTWYPGAGRYAVTIEYESGVSPTDYGLDVYESVGAQYYSTPVPLVNGILSTIDLHSVSLTGEGLFEVDDYFYIDGELGDMTVTSSDFVAYMTVKDGITGQVTFSGDMSGEIRAQTVAASADIDVWGDLYGEIYIVDVGDALAGSIEVRGDMISGSHIELKDYISGELIVHGTVDGWIEIGGVGASGGVYVGKIDTNGQLTFGNTISPTASVDGDVVVDGDVIGHFEVNIDVNGSIEVTGKLCSSIIIPDSTATCVLILESVEDTGVVSAGDLATLTVNDYMWGTIDAGVIHGTVDVGGDVLGYILADRFSGDMYVGGNMYGTLGDAGTTNNTGNTLYVTGAIGGYVYRSELPVYVYDDDPSFNGVFGAIDEFA